MESSPATIALVSLRAHDDEYAVPLGAACVASAIKAHGALPGAAKVELVDFDPSADAAAIARLLDVPRRAAIGFSLYCWNRLKLQDAAAILRARRPDLILFAGGPEAAALAAPQGAPAGAPGPLPFDAIFIGEAEDAVPGWLAARLSGAAGAGVARAGAVREIRCRASDTAALASPWLDGTLDPASCDSLTWEIVRGCPYACAYCYEGRGSRTVRRFPESRIEAELARFAAIPPRRVFVLDPTFNLDRARTLALLDLIAQRAPGHEWHFEVRAELLDRAQASAFARIGANLQIGLQSAHRDVLARVNRDIDADVFRRKLALLDEAGVAFGLDLIYGLPGDSLDGFRASLDYALSLRPNHLDVFPLSVLPGTELAERAGEWSLRYLRDPPYTVIGQPGFEADDMRAAASLARSCDVFYSRGRAVPWFGSAAKALGMRPSALLSAFARRMPPSGTDGLDHRGIEALQVSFLESAFSATPHDAMAGSMTGSMADAAVDLVRFNGALSRAMAEGERTILDLRYPLDDVAGAGILDLARFARRAVRSPDRISVEPSPDGPRVRRLRPAASRSGRSR